MKNKKIIKIAIIAIIIIETLILIYFIATKNNTQLSKTIQLNGEKMTDTSRITELEKQIDGLNSEHTTYGQYIQTSKAKIATAITNGGVSTSVDATADTMATNIATLATNRYNAGISAGKVGTATASQVLQGKTFTNSSGVGISGTMTNKGAWTSTPTGSGKVTIPAGYHNGSGYVNTATVYTNGYNAGANGKVRLKYVGQVKGDFDGSDGYAPRGTTSRTINTGISGITGVYLVTTYVQNGNYGASDTSSASTTPSYSVSGTNVTVNGLAAWNGRGSGHFTVLTVNVYVTY